MTAPLLYLLKVNVALLLFAAVYYGLLRRLTFFGLTRAYLVLALGFAVAYPAVELPAWPGSSTALPVALAGLVPTSAVAPTVAAPAAAFDWSRAAELAYVAGVVVLLGRLLLQLLAVRRLHRTSRPAQLQGQQFRQLDSEAGPFSFWQTIYLHPERHPAPELAAVLRHEQVHVRQWHTLDVLLAQLVLAVAWLNPAAWLLRRAVLDNLEYLADASALQTGLDRRAYQYSLLRLSHALPPTPLVSHFTFLTLKNRIAMMNTPASAAAQRVRYLLAAPLALGLLLGFGGAQARPAASALMQSPSLGPSVYYLDGQLASKAAVDQLDPKSIAFVNVLPEETARKVFGQGSGGVVVVVTTQNQNSAAVTALNEKIARVAPLVPGTSKEVPVNVLTPAALAYIVKTYPNSRIIGVSEIKYPSTGQTRYRVELAQGTRPHYAFFDEKGNVAKP